MRDIYFDHSATTPLHDRVLQAMMPYLTGSFGNPSSTHRWGKAARKAVEKAREQVAALINARPDEIIFTSGGTESDTAAILGAVFAHSNKGKHIITTSIEHRAILENCKRLEQRGYDVTYLPVDETGIIDPARLKAEMRPDTVLISVMHANNEIGTIQPVEEVGAIASQYQILFHCDAVQTAGRIPVDVRRINCDFLSISAHKMYGPKGVGCLYIRSGIEILPIIAGGGQERDLRGGTENVAGIVGLGEAAQLAMEEMDKHMWEMVFMRDRIIEGILERIPECHLNGHRFQRLPGHVNISFSGIKANDMLALLDEKGIAASSGSACHAASPGPSHVLKALGYSDEQASSALRVTLGRDNRDEDIDYFLAILPDVIGVLRDMAPAEFNAEQRCTCQDQPSAFH